MCVGPGTQNISLRLSPYTLVLFFLLIVSSLPLIPLFSTSLSLSSLCSPPLFLFLSSLCSPPLSLSLFLSSLSSRLPPLFFSLSPLCLPPLSLSLFLSSLCSPPLSLSHPSVLHLSLSSSL